MSWLSSGVVWAALVAAPAEDPFVEIRALDSAATFELEAIKGRCAGGQPDGEAEATAERAAQIHRTRIALARQRAGATSEEVVALAFQAADADQRAFSCNPGSVRHLEAAREVLVALRREFADPQGAAAQATDRRLAELEAGIAAGRPGPAAASNPPATTVRIVEVEGQVRPGPREDTYLGHLALRVEPGAALLRAGGPPVGFYQRGGALRLAVLARFTASERARIRLLFGPVFSFARLRDAREPGPGLLRGDVSVLRAGGQVEAEWRPSARVSWLSVHPAVELGLELQSYSNPTADQADRATGFYGGGGLALCVWNASICPGARVIGVPTRIGGSISPLVTVQLGLALDVMRWIDVAIARKRVK